MKIKKYSGAILLAAAMLFAMLPKTVTAEENSTYDRELAQYLTEISTERGFTVTREELEVSAADYGVTLADFGTVDQMRSSFGMVIKADKSNLDPVYSTYGLNEASLTQLLAGHGEKLEDYIFVTNLSYTLYFYTDGTVIQEPEFEQNLTHYLTGVSDKRGFIVTKEDLTACLKEKGTSLEAFSDVAELDMYLGEVISWDYGNLSKLYEDNGLEEASLLSLLEDNGRSMEDYIYLFQLEKDIASFSSDLTRDPGKAAEDPDAPDAEPVQEVSGARTEQDGQLPKTGESQLPVAAIGLSIMAAGICLCKRARTVRKETAE